MTRPLSSGGRRLGSNMAITWAGQIGGEDLRPVEGNLSGRCSAAQHLANGRLLGQCLAYLARPGYHFGQSGSKRYEKQKGAYGGKLT
jgi:hypothetical protein